MGLYAFIVQNGLPFGITWSHEEYHTAVMARRGIDSFNEVYEFPFGRDSVAVKGIKDQDLIRLANEHTPDLCG